MVLIEDGELPMNVNKSFFINPYCNTLPN